MARRQLLALGFSSREIERRIQRGRLYPVTRGVYSVGTKMLSPKGRWMAAVLACGEGACLSHRSAGALYGVCEERNGVVEISVRRKAKIERPGIRVRSRPSLPSQDVGALDRIPITSPVQTLIDLATELPTKLLSRAVNEADKLEVILARKSWNAFSSPSPERSDSPSQSPARSSTATKSTSSGPSCASSSRPTACAITAPPRPRPRTPAAIRPTPPPATPVCASPTTRSDTNLATSSGSSVKRPPA